MPKYRVKTSEIHVLCDPLAIGWGGAPIDGAEVMDAVSAKVTEGRSWQEVKDTLTQEESRIFHIHRVATFYRTGELGKMNLLVEHTYTPPKVYFGDGYHRFAAAYLRGDKNCGCMDFI